LTPLAPTAQRGFQLWKVQGAILEHDVLTEQIIGAAIEVHRVLGPGLLESIYEEALAVDLHCAESIVNDRSK